MYHRPYMDGTIESVVLGAFGPRTPWTLGFLARWPGLLKYLPLAMVWSPGRGGSGGAGKPPPCQSES